MDRTVSGHAGMQRKTLFDGRQLPERVYPAHVMQLGAVAPSALECHVNVGCVREECRRRAARLSVGHPDVVVLGEGQAHCRGDSRSDFGGPFRHEGVLGTVYTGELVREEQVGPYAGVIPTIGGQAWISGYSTHVLDPEDPFVNGFTVGVLRA